MVGAPLGSRNGTQGRLGQGPGLSPGSGHVLRVLLSAREGSLLVWVKHLTTKATNRRRAPVPLTRATVTSHCTSRCSAPRHPPRRPDSSYLALSCSQLPSAQLTPSHSEKLGGRFLLPRSTPPETEAFLLCWLCEAGSGESTVAGSETSHWASCSVNPGIASGRKVSHRPAS